MPKGINTRDVGGNELSGIDAGEVISMKSNEPIDGLSDAITTEIEKRSIAFVHDNFSNPTAADFLRIKTAMLIGSSVALEHGDTSSAAGLRDEHGNPVHVTDKSEIVCGFHGTKTTWGALDDIQKLAVEENLCSSKDLPCLLLPTEKR